MGWKIIEIEQGSQLNLFLNNLVIRKDNDKILIPINDIDVLLINNPYCKITINLINELAKNNILTIVCNNKYIPEANILPIIGNFNTVKILEQQTQWSNDYKGKIWKSIVKQKIFNQSKLLEKLGFIDELNKLLILYNEVKFYDVSNREGHASKIYWHTLFGINFKRHEDDFINNLLNYGYSILRSYLCRSIIKKGLDPRIAFFHKSFHNYFALASDLMEVFRSIIDYEVYKIYKNKDYPNLYQNKDKLIECFNNKVFVDDKKHFINNAIDLFIDSIVNNTELPKIIIDYEWI